MSDPYIPPEDRLDVIGRLTARLDEDGGKSLREKAATQAVEFEKDPGTFEKPVKDEGEKDDKDLKDGKEDQKDTKETKDFNEKDFQGRQGFRRQR